MPVTSNGKENKTGEPGWDTEKKDFNSWHLQAEWNKGSGPRGTGAGRRGRSGLVGLWSLQIPQEAETFMQKLLAGPQVVQLLWQRGDPAVCVEDALTDLHHVTKDKVWIKDWLIASFLYI